MIIVVTLIIASAFGSNPINPGVQFCSCLLGFVELVGWHAIIGGVIDTKRVASMKSMIAPLNVRTSTSKNQKVKGA